MRKYFLFLTFSCCFILAEGQSLFPAQQKVIMQQKVVDACRHAWNGYKHYAWGADDLKPLTKQPRVWYKHSMLMTPVDAFDTFTMLGMKSEAEEAKKLILEKLDFNVDNEVQVFEVTIRLVGGLITAYELDGDRRFLKLANDLGKRLLPAFNSPTGMPYRYVHLQTGKTRDHLNNPAEIGTLMMELGKLSKLTNDNACYDAAKKAIMYVFNKRSKLNLVGTVIDVTTGEWVNTESHISARIDSYFEYLYKSWLLFRDKDFKNAWQIHKASIQKYLLSKQDSGWFYTRVDMNTGKETKPLYGALDAFYAALLAYAGDLKIAREVQRANYFMWRKYNIEPEEFNFKTGQLIDGSYALRPEILESCFYLYRATNDDQYLWMGKRIIEDILKYCKTDAGFASLKSITTFEKSNSMESFLFAETFKYAWLLFSPSSALNLNKVVLSTEAHPFRK